MSTPAVKIKVRVDADRAAALRSYVAGMSARPAGDADLQVALFLMDVVRAFEERDGATSDPTLPALLRRQAE